MKHFSVWCIFFNLNLFLTINHIDCAHLAPLYGETETTTIGPYAILDDEEESVTEEPRAMNMPKYLNKLGYLTDKQAEEHNALAEDAFESAVREYQRFMNIKETGKLDATTLAHMKKPRCGNKDFDRSEFIDGKRALESESDKTKRFAVFGEKWPRKLVTYKIATYPSSRQIKRRTVDLEIRRAFDAWSKVIPLTFQKSSGRVDIEIRFEKGYHGCWNAVFERPQYDNVLAHAYGPGPNGINGDVHFNDYYIWSVDPAKGHLLYSTAVHEIGHSLGLLHSDYAEAVMYPVERNLMALHRDDITGIQRIYGRKRKQKPKEEVDTSDDDSESDSESDSDAETSESEDDVDNKKEEEKKLPKCESAGRWLFPGPTCKQYYDCRSGKPKLRSCKGNLVWKKSENWCDFPHNVPECRVKY